MSSGAHCHVRSSTQAGSNAHKPIYIPQTLYTYATTTSDSPLRNTSRQAILLASHPTHLKHHRATIDDDIGPVYIPPRLTNQHNQRPRQLPRMPHPSKRIPTIPRIPRHLQPIPLIQNRIHVPWAQRVNPDPKPAPLGSQTLRQAQNGRLGRIVRGLRLRVVGVVRGDARGEDDAAARALSFNLTREGLCAEKAAREVDVGGATPLVGVHVDGVRAAHDAGEAAQDVDAAEQLYSVGEGGRDLCFVAHVDGFGDDFHVGELSVEGGDGGEGLVGVEVPEGEA